MFWNHSNSQWDLYLTEKAASIELRLAQDSFRWSDHRRSGETSCGRKVPLSNPEANVSNVPIDIPQGLNDVGIIDLQFWNKQTVTQQVSVLPNCFEPLWLYISMQWVLTQSGSCSHQLWQGEYGNASVRCSQKTELDCRLKSEKSFKGETECEYLLHHIHSVAKKKIQNMFQQRKWLELKESRNRNKDVLSWAPGVVWKLSLLPK